MNWKLVTGFACGAALLLGACSGNNTTGASSGSAGADSGVSGTDTDGNGDSNGDGNGDSNGDAESPAQTAFKRAEGAVELADDALELLETADTEANRADAREKIAEARRLLAAALMAAEAAVTAAEGGDDNTAYVQALEFRDDVRNYRTRELARLNAAEVPLFWYNRPLLRQAIPNGTARAPSDGTNVATVARTARTKDTSATDTAQIANTDPANIKSADFRTIMYSAGKKVFSGSGDEFKVDGYVSGTTTSQLLDIALKTGLKLTSAGLEIRSGGAVGSGAGINTFTGDYLDMRKKIDTTVGGGISSGGWDLAIKFDQPQTRSATGGVSSWTGNGDFYWRAIAPVDRRQLDSTETAYYTASTYTQPSGFKDLGTYEVWLSNHIGLDPGLEPTAGSGAPPYPDDDVQEYLNYAAYGMFVFTPDAAVGAAIPTDRGRIQSMYFGYEAFKDETGKKTTDISKAITSGTFHGQTIATAFKGDRVPGGTTGNTDFETKLLRGDVELTVSIPKSTGSGTLIGTIDNFAEWNGVLWKGYTDDFKVSFDNGTDDTAISIGDGGTFSGRASLAVGTGDPFTVGNADAAGEVGNSGAGQVKGNFYGPRTDTELEIAGSWIVGHAATSPENDHAEWKITGSFGAKQRAAAPSN